MFYKSKPHAESEQRLNKCRLNHCSKQPAFANVRPGLITFIILLLFGLAAGAALAWLLLRQRAKGSPEFLKPSPIPQQTVQTSLIKHDAETLTSSERVAFTEKAATLRTPEVAEEPKEPTPNGSDGEIPPQDEAPSRQPSGEQPTPLCAQPEPEPTHEVETIAIVEDTAVPVAEPPVTPKEPEIKPAAPVIALPLETPMVAETETPQAATSPAAEAEVAQPGQGEQPKAPSYQPPKPVAPKEIRPRRTPTPRQNPTPETNADLRLRVQLVFGRGGGVKSIAFVPDRRDGMPDEIDITGTQGKQYFAKLKDDCYESVNVSDPGNALSSGIEWKGRCNGQNWRWVLGGRNLYVLAEGDEIGIHGFVSRRKDPRLLLNARHAVLAAAHLRQDVVTALAEVGCTAPEISDDTIPGVPPGWLIFREVKPVRSAAMRDEAHILNALCPLPNIEPHFIGGIRLQERTWLAGFPPRIRFTGKFASDFRVTIDGQDACAAPDGAFEAPGWDSTQEHRLWFSGQSINYTVSSMNEDWPTWQAHDFGTGAAICGAATDKRIDGARWQQVRIPVANPLLIGAQPGEVYCCNTRSDVRCETILTMVPFAPVWALPLNPARADKRSARILLFNPKEPAANAATPKGKRSTNQRILNWISAVREAGCKGLKLAPDTEPGTALWRQYRDTAKQLRRKMR